MSRPLIDEDTQRRNLDYDFAQPPPAEEPVDPAAQADAPADAQTTTGMPDVSLEALQKAAMAALTPKQVIAPHSYSQAASDIRDRVKQESDREGMSQALYHATTRTPIPDSAFTRGSDLESKFMLQELKNAKGKVEELDPNAPTHQMARAVFARNYPELATQLQQQLGPSGWNSLTAKQLDAYSKSGFQADKDVAAANKLKAAEALFNRRMDFQKDKQQHREEQDKVLYDQREKHFNATIAMRAMGMSDVQARNEGAALTKFAQDNKDLTWADATLKEAYSAIGSSPGKLVDDPEAIKSSSMLLNAANRVPWGIGNRIYDFLHSGTPQEQLDKQHRVTMATNLMRQKILRADAGANLTENEVKQFQEIFNNRAMDDTRYALMAMDLFRQTVGRKLQTQEAGLVSSVSPAAYDSYKKTGGLSSEDEFYADAVDPKVKAAREAMRKGIPPFMTPQQAVKMPAYQNMAAGLTNAPTTVVDTPAEQAPGAEVKEPPAPTGPPPVAHKKRGPADNAKVLAPQKAEDPPKTVHMKFYDKAGKLVHEDDVPEGDVELAKRKGGRVE